MTKRAKPKRKAYAGLHTSAMKSGGDYADAVMTAAANETCFCGAPKQTVGGHKWDQSRGCGSLPLNDYYYEDDGFTLKRPAPAAKARRCLVTGNPCGTDTWPADKPCACGECVAYLANTAAKETHGDPYCLPPFNEHSCPKCMASALAKAEAERDSIRTNLQDLALGWRDEFSKAKEQLDAALARGLPRPREGEAVKHTHRFVWLGWLRNAKLPSNTIDVHWCDGCGSIKTRRYIRGRVEPHTKITRAIGRTRFVNTLVGP